jgi:hypothetical protein
MVGVLAARDPEAVRSEGATAMTTQTPKRRPQPVIDPRHRQRDLVRASLMFVRTSKPTHRRWA